MLVVMLGSGGEDRGGGRKGMVVQMRGGSGNAGLESLSSMLVEGCLLRSLEVLLVTMMAMRKRGVLTSFQLIARCLLLQLDYSLESSQASAVMARLKHQGCCIYSRP